MHRTQRPPVLALVILLTATLGAQAQRVPHIGYLYPAGAQRGTTTTITVGGQYLDGAAQAYFSDPAVHATVVEHIKPISQKVFNELRTRMRMLQGQRRSNKISFKQMAQQFSAFAREKGLKEMTLAKFIELIRQRNDPKRQPNPQLGETVVLEVTIDKQAEPGLRDFRLNTKLGLTNPLFFRVGQYHEYTETEPNDHLPDAQLSPTLPAVINGQITPGDVDRFRFSARRGMHLVAAVEARRLIPFLADAVPGWFQATLRLCDADGNELAFCDDYRFHPDPVIAFEIPEDGDYILEIHDAIYRGRQDFVYRLTLGAVPFVTDIFPLGGRAGGRRTVALRGWNLPVNRMAVDMAGAHGRAIQVRVRQGRWLSNAVPFQVDGLPSCRQVEPNQPADHAQPVKLPVVIDGCIDQPGDRDVYRFAGRARQRIIAEVHARRLGSPLDSLITLTDTDGQLLAANDDHDDPGCGLVTHQADSLIDFTLPRSGAYLLHLSDAQQHGGPAYAYRLRLTAPQPDFALRVVPSSINARTGQTVLLTVYALRHDGFAGPIDLALNHMPKGFILGGGRIPAGQDKIQLTLTVPSEPQPRPVPLHVEGRARIAGKPVTRAAEPAEDMMQAFLYRHLVPMTEGMVSVIGPRRPTNVKVTSPQPIQLTPGGRATVRLTVPRWLARQMQLELADPPKGIAIASVKPDGQGLEIALSLSKQAESIRAGNLIVRAFVVRELKNKSGKSRGKRRVPLGVLPAISFEMAPASRG